jgi:hypothetical protein
MQKYSNSISLIIKQNLWLAWSILFILTLAIFSFRKIHSNDFWWVLALGQHFWDTKEIINYDVFSYTFPNDFFWNHSRLFDALLYWFYDHGKYLSLNIFRLILLALSYFFAYKTINLKKHHKLITILLLTITLIPLGDRLLFRPELATMTLTVAYLYILFKDKYKTTRFIWLLPILQVIWANSHAGFVYGLAIVGIFFGSEFLRSIINHRNNLLLFFNDKRTKKLFIIFCLTILASFATSYGWQIIPLIYKTFTPETQIAAAGISEWHKFSILNFFNLANIAYIPILLSVIVIFIKNYKLKINFKQFSQIKNLTWEEIFLLVLYIYSATTHTRFVYISTLITTIIAAKNIYPLIKKKWVFNKYWPHVLIFLSFMFIISTHQTKQWGLGPETNRYPEQAVKFIKDQKIPGKMLNNYGQGGYLTFNLYPEKQVFIDGRTPNLYTSDFFWRYSHLKSKNIRQDLLKKYDVNFWLWPRNDGLQQTLWADEAWILIYFDNLSTIYIKNEEKNQKLIDRFAYKFFTPTNNEKQINDTCSEKNLSNDPDLKNKLIKELENGLQNNTQNWLLYKNLALVYQSCQFDPQDLPIIKNYLKQALTINPNDNQLQYQIGFTELQLENNQSAAFHFQKAGITNAAYLTGLGTAQYNLGQYKKALKTLLKARQTPGKIDNKYYQTLGRVYYALDKYELAIEYHHRYQDLTRDFSAESYTDLAQSHFYNGDIEQANNYLILALKNDPNLTTALELQKEMQK